MRKRIPRLGRWPTNAAEVWKLAAAEYRRVAHRRSRIIEALMFRISSLELLLQEEPDHVEPFGIRLSPDDAAIFFGIARIDGTLIGRDAT